MYYGRARAVLAVLRKSHDPILPNLTSFGSWHHRSLEVGPLVPLLDVPRRLHAIEWNPFLQGGGGLEHGGRLLLQRHHVDDRGLRRPRPDHHVRQALHVGLHLCRVGPHRGVHQYRNPGNLE